MTWNALTPIGLSLCALLAGPAGAQETRSLADVLNATHVHGIGSGTNGADSLTLATHHGLWAVDMIARTASRIGSSPDDFMGYSAVAGSPGAAFASGHPAGDGNIGVITTADGGATWTHVSDGLGGPVDFHNMEVSRADPSIIYGIGHDGRVQRSSDSGKTWEATGQVPDKLIDIATSATEAATIYAATELGLYRSLDKGATWTEVVTGAPFTTVDLGADGVLRAVQYGKGVLSIGADGTATLLGTDLPDGYLLYLASISADPHRLAALSGTGRLMLSEDGGSTWSDATLGK